jgi:hypothetical protein
VGAATLGDSSRQRMPPILGANCSTYCSSPPNSPAAWGSARNKGAPYREVRLEHAGNSENYCVARFPADAQRANIVTSRSYRRNIANGARMRITEMVASRPASPIGERAKILGISPERGTKATRAALPLIADGHSLVWKSRLVCFAYSRSKGAKLPLGKEGVSRKLRKGRRFSEFTTTSVVAPLSIPVRLQARLIEKTIIDFLRLLNRSKLRRSVEGAIARQRRSRVVPRVLSVELYGHAARAGCGARILGVSCGDQQSRSLAPTGSRDGKDSRNRGRCAHCVPGTGLETETFGC